MCFIRAVHEIQAKNVATWFTSSLAAGPNASFAALCSNDLPSQAALFVPFPYTFLSCSSHFP